MATLALALGWAGCVDGGDDPTPTPTSTTEQADWSRGVCDSPGVNPKQLRPNDCRPPAEVQGASHVYLVYWGWRSDPDNDIPTIETFLRYAGGSRYLNTVTQYEGAPTGPNGSKIVDPSARITAGPSPTLPVSGGLLVDTWHDPVAVYNTGDAGSDGSYPRDRAAAVAEVIKAIDHFVSAGTMQPYDPNAIIVILNPKYDATNATREWPSFEGGYHDSVGGSGSNQIAFVEMPYPSATSGSTTALMTHDLAHELLETMTDPYRDPAPAGKTLGPKTGWYGAINLSTSATENENADYCNDGTIEFEFVQLGPNPADVFSFPSSWSNSALGGGGTCARSYTTAWESYRSASDGNLWFQTSVRSWGTAFPPTKITGALDAALSGNGRTDVVAIDQSKYLVHGYTSDSGWSWSWDSLGLPYGSTAYSWSKPSIAASGYAQLDVYALARSRYGSYLRHLPIRGGAVGGWNTISTPFTATSAPTAVSPRPGWMDVFVPDTTGLIQHGRATDGSGNPPSFSPLPPPAARLVDYPDATSWSNGRWDLVQVDANGAVEHTEGDEEIGWNGWGWDVWKHPMWDSGRMFKHVTMTQLGDHRLRFEATDDVGNLWTATYDWVYLTPWNRVDQPSTWLPGTALTSR